MGRELDLELGEPDDDAAGGRGGGTGGGRGDSERTKRRHRASLNDRLSTIFDRLAQSLEGRGDDELAGMIREDSKAMVGGLVSMTRRVPGLATPLLGGLAVLEPLIAFGRVFRLLLRRMGERRAAAMAGYDDDGRDDEPAPPEPMPEEERRDEARPWELG